MVDANVAVKWVLPEIHSDVASRLLTSDYTLSVHDFFFSEIGNIFWKQVFTTAAIETAFDLTQGQPRERSVTVVRA